MKTINSILDVWKCSEYASANVRVLEKQKSQDCTNCFLNSYHIPICVEDTFALRFRKYMFH